eukprot:scaffold78699_cov64-Phaeocystis_antarctica.AAC.3
MRCLDAVCRWLRGSGPPRASSSYATPRLCCRDTCMILFARGLNRIVQAKKCGTFPQKSEHCGYPQWACCEGSTLPCAFVRACRASPEEAARPRG